jgi:hypothetical protein
MSYVIQNFYDSNKKITLTPRFKFFFILTNLDKFFIFFKFNTFINVTFKVNSFNISYWNIFFKYFFSKQFIKFVYQLNLDYIGNYTNNLTKSYIYYIFFNINNFFKIANLNFKFINSTPRWIDNLYLLPIKILNIRINSTFYKNIFFYFMLINSFLWYQHSSNLRFYLNFIFINYNLKTSRFYNGYFLRIYNY